MGRLWDYSSTHSRLAIEWNVQGERPAYLVLLGCSDIRMPTVWVAESPCVRAEGEGFVFTDKDVQIVFMYEFQFREDYHR
ncbi:hypothetical protein D7X12_08410 [Corallococcus sicarius]|uniref:Uncharacterized protein n=1 Tax=Corallococcus sicarius TaxID=2316726 RepID=A0A3A8NYL8_9BACT|nr:hypothetical protein D7X12_08410 [Corallococcus sicarius]